MNDDEERFRDIILQCDKIRNSLSSMQFYLSAQLIIVISYISIPWTYEYQRFTINYLTVRLLQYSFHLFSVIRIKQTVEVISDGYMAYIDQFEPIDVWAAVKGNHNALAKCNQLVYIIMFLVGNVVFLQNYLLLQKWVIIVQLIFGWIVIATLLIFILAICIILPYLIYRTYQQRRQEMLRRQVLAQHLVSKQMKYSELDQQSHQPCYICLQNFTNDDLIIQLACNHNHIFHSPCIQPWAERSDTCPVCRQKLQ